MKQYQAQYTLGEVYIRPINGEGIFLYDLGYFVDYKEFKETLIKDTGFYPEECYVSSSSLSFYEEGCSLENAFKRYRILETIENGHPDLIFEYDRNIKDLRQMSNEELSEIKKWWIIYETLDEFIEIEIQDNSELLTPDVVRKRVEEKVRNHEIIELSKGWLLVKML